jgi:hypothetical protein
MGGFIYLFGRQEVLAQEIAERDVFINIHSGLKTMPVRKVIGAIINQAEERGVTEILGIGKHVEWDVWDISITFLKKMEEEKEAKTKELMWRYGRESWDIKPMNAETQSYSFPMDKYVMGPAINMALGMIEERGIKAQDITGRGEKLSDGRWQFVLTAIDPQGGTHVQEWQYAPKAGELAPQNFDHLDLDKALASCVTTKGIDYKALKKNAPLAAFLKMASKMDKTELEGLPRSEQLAFWINVYNATVLQQVAARYPVKSVKEIKGFFDKQKLTAAGKTFTLNGLRDYLLGKDFQENRVLFALVSGTKSSPPLRKEAYCGRLLESQLEDNLKSFLNQPANLYVTEAGLLLSPVLEPLAKEGTLRDFLTKVSASIPPDVARSLADPKKDIKFVEYDWNLNKGE